LKDKKILRMIKFYARSGDLNNSPPIGPMLGQFPMDVKNFCTIFNTQTKEFDNGVLLKVILILYKNGSFTFTVKLSPLFFLLELGSTIIETPRKYEQNIISLYDIYLITLIKNKEYNLINIKYLFKKILRIAKKNKYKILEGLEEKSFEKNIYYFYV